MQKTYLTIRAWHYKFDSCPYSVPNEFVQHGGTEDNALFIYMTAPAVPSYEIKRKNGNVDMLYTHPILNKEVFEQDLEDQIFILPVQDGDRTFSINGTVLMNIEPPETGSDLPDYVRAFHFHQWSGNYADFRIGGEDPEGKLPRSLILDLGEDGIVEWDADGKVLTNTAGDISRYLPE